MNKRYFYRGPLAVITAAWMSECHKVKFTDVAGNPLILAIPDGEIAWYLPRSVPYTDNEFYIHPESHHILHPRDGDRLEGDFEGIPVADVVGDKVYYGEHARHSCFLEEFIELYQFTICKRNGLSFYHPEVETSKNLTTE